MQDVSASANTAYTLSGRYRTANNPPSRDIGIDFLNGSGNQIGSSASVGVSISNAYATFSLPVTAPAGTAEIKVWTYTGNAGTLIVDELELVETGCN